MASLVLLACGRQSSDAPRVEHAFYTAPPGEMAATAEQSLYVARSAPARDAQGATAGVAQKLIRTATLRIEVRDIQKAVHAADSIATRHGAIVAENRLGQDADERHQARLVVRVPADSFAEALAALKRLGDVRDEMVNTQDVTREYTDLATRLAVKEQAVARLRSLLEGRTAKLSDVLEVERELTRAVTELEQMKGEQRYYDQQIALSTITLSLYDRTPSRVTQVTVPVAEAFAGSLHVLGRSLAGMIYIVSVLLPWALLALLVRWVYVQRRSRAQQIVRQEITSPQ
jgi:hypothetical protein